MNKEKRWDGTYQSFRGRARWVHVYEKVGILSVCRPREQGPGLIYSADGNFHNTDKRGGEAARRDR